MSDEKDPKEPPGSADVRAGEPREDFPEEDDLRSGLPAEQEEWPPEDDLPEGQVLLDEVDLKDALRGALRPPPGSVAPSLLRGVQKKLRVRSRGKFYGDGWSNSSSPRSTYLITSAVMLVLVLVVCLVLLPWSSAKLP
jgi:hypothetical protein